MISTIRETNCKQITESSHMTSKNSPRPDPCSGFIELVISDANQVWQRFFNAQKDLYYHKLHPFHLPVMEGSNILFVGGGGDVRVRTVVTLFLDTFRYFLSVNIQRGVDPIYGLRVITTPYHDLKMSHHFVFFEVMVKGMHIISGETLNFDSSDTLASDMMRLENVFSAISLVHNIEIARVSARAVSLGRLYQNTLPTKNKKK